MEPGGVVGDLPRESRDALLAQSPRDFPRLRLALSPTSTGRGEGLKLSSLRPRLAFTFTPRVATCTSVVADSMLLDNVPATRLNVHNDRGLGVDLHGPPRAGLRPPADHLAKG